MTRQATLPGKTFSNLTIKAVKEITPNAVGAKRRHVPGMGYVFYIKDASGNVIGHVYESKVHGFMEYSIK